jgi:UDP:flavonoid glycosyltransferase YjiC (YdhE family)
VCTLDHYVQQDLKVLREFKPDIVVGDQRHSLATSSRLAGVPYVNIIDGHWCPAAGIEIELLDSAVTQIIGIPVMNLLYQFIRPLGLVYQTMPMNIVRIKYGLPGLGPDFKTVFTYGDYVVYPNDPKLFPLKRPLPPKHQFIGPLIWSPDVEKPEWWDKLPQGRPIVYVSLGSTGQPNLLEVVFRVLGELPVTVIAATAARKKMHRVPNNVFLADFLPGTEAAQRSRLVICNGGTMSGQQALSAGIPFLGLISNVDQLLFAKAVSRTGACEFIREGEVNENTLRHFITLMLAQESYQNAAKLVAARTANGESCQKFERVIRSMIEERGRRKAHWHTTA